MTRVGDDPAEFPLVVPREIAIAAGLTRGQISHRVASGRWRVVARGHYLRVAALDAVEDEFERSRMEHVATAVAAARVRPGSVIAFGSAALAHGLPLLGGPPPRVQLIVPEGAWTGLREGVRFRSGRLDPRHIAAAMPPVTSVARTCVDIARYESLASALVVGDAAVGRGLVSVDDACHLLKGMGTVRGCRRAAAALPWLSGLRESPLESRSWAAFLDWNIPLPEMQQPIWDGQGFIGRVDFLWREFGVIGEADGRLKYTGDALWDEKRREDRLRALGFRVVRWSWHDLGSRKAAVRAALQSALREGH